MTSALGENAKYTGFVQAIMTLCEQIMTKTVSATHIEQEAIAALVAALVAARHAHEFTHNQLASLH